MSSKTHEAAETRRTKGIGEVRKANRVSEIRGTNQVGKIRETNRTGERESRKLGDSLESRESWTLDRPVFFVGFMGAGKTTVARRLARSLRIVSVDTDAYIERDQGKKTSKIFAEQGEEGFREIEHRVLAEVATLDPCFVSCGGGIIIREDNRELLKRVGYVVYLQVDVDEVISRISRPETRPLLGDLDAARALNEKRLVLYREVADVTLNTAGKTSGYVASLVRRILKKEGILYRSCSQSGRQKDS